MPEEQPEPDEADDDEQDDGGCHPWRSDATCDNPVWRACVAVVAACITPNTTNAIAAAEENHAPRSQFRLRADEQDIDDHRLITRIGGEEPRWRTWRATKWPR